MTPVTDLPPPPQVQPPSLRGILPSLVISGACPFVTYQLLMAYVPSLSKVTALAISAIFPAAHGIAGIVRRRYLDFIGIMVLIGIAVTIVATYVGGDPKLLLIRESFVTGALGLVALSSFLWRRPLLFYIGRQFSAGQDRERLAQFNGLWARPGGRHTFRMMTAVWAVGWLGEFALRVAMVETLTIPQVLAVSPFVFNTINIGLMAWTVAYVRRRRRRALEAPARGGVA